MDIKITFLGTGAMQPTRERNAPAVLAELAGRSVLFDCGEGTQRQLQFAGVSSTTISTIALTHWHGDHVGGLAPLLQSIYNLNRTASISICGPIGTRERFEHLRRAIDIPVELPITITDLDPHPASIFTVFSNQAWELRCAWMEHGVPTLGYALIERDKYRLNEGRASTVGLYEGVLIGKVKRGETVELNGRFISRDDVCEVVRGRRIVLVTDTCPNENIVRLADAADLMICESTFSELDAELASKSKHMTAADAALAARHAGAKRLVLTHFSQRYPGPEPLLEEAQRHFENVQAAKDLMELTIEYPKRTGGSRSSGADGRELL